MKNMTYNNLLRGIRIMMSKGYDREEAEELARMTFDKVKEDRTGWWTFEKIAAMVLDKEAYQEEYKTF